MARHRRIELAGGLAHVLARGIDGAEIFRDDSDRHQFLWRLSKGLQRTGFKCLAWSLMPNHYHLAIRTNDDRLHRLMRGLNGGYALWFNKKYSRKGYLFQDRFKSIICQDSLYAKELIRYVHLNPVRGKIVKDINVLSHYYWCGHRSILGRNEGCAWQETREVHRLFGKDVAGARRKYLQFLKEGLVINGSDDENGPLLPEKEYDDDAQSVAMPGILGDSSFIRQTLSNRSERAISTLKLRAEGWNLDMMAKAVAQYYKIPILDLIRPANKVAKASKAKAMLALLSFRVLGYATNKIAEYLSIKQPAVSHLCRKAERSLFESNSSDNELFSAIAAFGKEE